MLIIELVVKILKNEQKKKIMIQNINKKFVHLIYKLYINEKVKQ